MELVFEIGTEEIPAGYITGVLPELKSACEDALKSERIAFEKVVTLGAPRRLVLAVTGIADKQSDLDMEIVGPPARIGFDEAGKPTKAALGFAKKNNIDPSDLIKKEVPEKKGEYVVGRLQQSGQPTGDVLKVLLPKLAAKLHWPKSMRWSDKEEPFVRPVQWLLATLGNTLIPFEFAGIATSTQSRGHRFLSPGNVDFDGSFEDFKTQLRKHFVVVDPIEREESIRTALKVIEDTHKLKVRPDESLIKEVANLVEYPFAVFGDFDKKYLEVPNEAVVSAMRSHQRYFALENSKGQLVNHFVTIAGTKVEDMNVVKKGNERVLAARLEDAKYFFTEDNKTSLDTMAEKLGKVVFQKKLGSVGDKAQRLINMGLPLEAKLGIDIQSYKRAAKLCKADLVSHMVGEFPDLQGVMGAKYAKKMGENDKVVNAIEDHYLPKGASDRLPSSQEGAALGVADRLDTLVGCFAANLAPTGSADPFGLRRAALAVIRILDDKKWKIDFQTLCDMAKDNFGSQIDFSKEKEKDLLAFFKVRTRSYLLDGLSIPQDCVDAALAASLNNPSDLRQRAEALANAISQNSFAPLASAFKRISNILKGQNAQKDPNPELFSKTEEKNLWDTFSTIQKRVQTCVEENNYSSALETLTELRTPVDNYFENVMVMDKDEDIKKNRIAMLSKINQTFSKIADFRQLSLDSHS